MCQPSPTRAIRCGYPQSRGKSKAFYFADTKTKGSRRVVPLPASLVRQLREHRATPAEALLKLGIRSDLVFSNSEGMPLLRRNIIKRHYKPALLAAGLPAEARLYDLRHTVRHSAAGCGDPPENRKRTVRTLRRHTDNERLQPRNARNARGSNRRA